MSPAQIALLVAAAALLAGPQILQAVQRATADRGAAAPGGGRPFDREAAVSMLLRLQSDMSAAGLNTASDLTGRLLVELVTNGKSPAPQPGAKK